MFEQPRYETMEYQLPRVDEGKRLDPLTFSVIQSKVAHTAWVIRETMLRASRSTILNTCADYSTGIFDKDGWPIHVPDLLPIQMCGDAPAIQAVIETYEGDIEPGDAFINNEPYQGNAHIGEINVVCPVFYEGALLFWCLDRPHHNDIGCYLPSSINIWAKDIYEEGLHLPPYRIARDRKIDMQFVQLLSANIRYPEMFKGDFLGSIGSIWAGESKILEICKRYGLATMEQWIDEWMNYGDRRMTEEIQKLPKGVWYQEEACDPGPWGASPRIRIKLSIDPDEAIINIDMTETDDDFPFGVNCTWSCIRGAVINGTLQCLDPTLPRNQGAWRHMRITTRKGSMVDPNWPKATSSATTWLPDRTANAIYKIFARVDPERGHSAGGMEGSGLPYLVGVDHTRDNQPYGGINFLCYSGGPASKGYDGWPAFASPIVSGAMLQEPVEMHELRYPHIVWEGGFTTDFVGHGQWRGGPAPRVRIEPRNTDMTIITFSDGFYNPPGGVLGGGEGIAYPHMARDAGTGKKIRDMGNDKPYVVKDGEVWEGCGCSGGGFGDPVDRDPELVRYDAREEFISLESARDIYGVVLDTEPELYAVNYEATRKLREEIREKPAEERHREVWEKFQKKNELPEPPRELIEEPRDAERAWRWAEEMRKVKAEQGFV